jgi:uncharacterized protein DUF4238
VVRRSRAGPHPAVLVLSIVKHHYVPEFYLRAFTDRECPPGYEPYLWVADFEERKHYRRAPANAAAVADYYVAQEIEERLGQLESRAAPVIRGIVGGNTTLTAEDRSVLSGFIAVQMVRVPAFRGRLEEFVAGAGGRMNAFFIQDRARYERALRETSPDRQFTEQEVDELHAVARDPANYRIVANPGAVLGIALKAAPTVEIILRTMSWSLMTPAIDDMFWTSDCPVYWLNPKSQTPLFGHGLAAKDIELTFPLSPQVCLLATWSQTIPPVKRLDQLGVTHAQRRAIAGAQRFAFCSSEQAARDALAVRQSDNQAAQD